MEKKFLIGFLSALIITLSVMPSIFAANMILRPNGQGFYTSWNNLGCNAALEYQCVDEPIANTSDYLYSSILNAKESFQFDNSGLTTEKIRSVTLNYNAKRWGTYNYYIKPLIRGVNTNGSYSDYVGSQLYLSTVYGLVSQEFAKNPLTNLPWTIADLDNLEAGMTTGSLRPGGLVSQVYTNIDYDDALLSPDLVIWDINVYKYSYPNNSSNNQSGNTVTVSLVIQVKNIGGNTADASILNTVGLTNTNNSNINIGTLKPNSIGYGSAYYKCTENHLFTATADYTNVLVEGNETNNQKSVYINCTI